MARLPKAQVSRRPNSKGDGRLHAVADQPVPEALPEATDRLWLCLHFPQLPLEAQAGRLRPDKLLAISEERGRRAFIVTANARATARGVQAGMPVNSALALVPELRLGTRSMALEAVALTRLATWACQFTPLVSISAGNALLLEVQGSLRLFNGLDALRARVTEGLGVLGHQARIACAPTARAALWLARAGIGQPVRSARELHRVLASVHICHLGWPARTVEMLLQMGLTTVGDCVRLPRDGFARRLGPRRQRELDQAYGRHPDPQQPHRLSARFSAALELPAETTDILLVLEGFRQLFGQLKDALESGQASVRGVWCGLVHPGGRGTRLRLGLTQAAGPATAANLLPGLLRLRLEAGRLPEGVTSLTLQARLEPGQALSGTDLLGQCLQAGGGLHTLLERLRARLGEPAVQGFALHAEHRPEGAWRAVAEPLADNRAGDPPVVERSRPVWLLAVPEPLGLIAGQPAWRGLLSLERGPERIESGWWDGGDVRRDYYRASNPQGAMLWIFRNLRSRAWYLHGVFG